jgi:hypothetical protein
LPPSPEGQSDAESEEEEENQNQNQNQGGGYTEHGKTIKEEKEQRSQVLMGLYRKRKF